MNDRSRRVVLLIDYDNLQICAARDTPGRDLQLTPVVQLAQRYGTVILARAYAEWNLSTERLAVYKAGIEPAFAPVLRTESDRSGKSLADTVMVAEGMDMLWTLSPEVVVLATSDKDLIPLVRVAKQRGAFVVVLGSDFTAIPLREMADEHLTYRQLITDVGGRTATEGGPGRQPAALPEPSRRRRERNGRERSATAGAPPTPQPQPQAQPQSQARVERETAPSAATSVEPVAPVTTSAPGEADMQTSSRRRRRRGSRRRSDRLGLTTETASGGDSTLSEDEEATDSLEEGITPAEQITPTSSAIEEAPAQAVTEVAPAGEAPPADEAAPAPRTRRRRTRLRAGEGAEAIEAAAVAGEAPVEATPPPQSPPVPEQSADISPAPPPEVTSNNGPTSAAAEMPAAKPARPRRVASASRGRTRRP